MNRRTEIEIEPVKNGWVIRVLNMCDYTGSTPFHGTYVFTTPTDLGRWIEDYYKTKKEE